MTTPEFGLCNELRGGRIGFHELLPALSGCAGPRGCEGLEFGCKLPGAGEIGKEAGAQVIVVEPVFADQLDPGGVVASLASSVGPEQILDEGEVMRETIEGVEIDLKIERRAERRPADDLPKVGVEFGS